MRDGLIQRLGVGLRNGCRYVGTMADRVRRREAPIRSGELLADLRGLSGRVFPELQRIEDDGALHRVVRTATERVGSIGRTIVIVTVAAVVAWLLVRPRLHAWAQSQLVVPPAMASVLLEIAGLLPAVIGVLCAVRLHRRQLGIELRSAMNDLVREMWIRPHRQRLRSLPGVRAWRAPGCDTIRGGRRKLKCTRWGSVHTIRLGSPLSSRSTRSVPWPARGSSVWADCWARA